MIFFSVFLVIVYLMSFSSDEFTPVEEDEKNNSSKSSSEGMQTLKTSCRDGVDVSHVPQ